MRKQSVLWTLAVIVVALLATSLSAESIPVRFASGLLHGFLVLRNQNGEALADGEVTQIAHGDRVTNHSVFRFKDGSLNEETVVFYQHNNFQLISDHLVQKGPSFPRPLDVLITKSTGEVTIHYTEDGKEKVINDRMTLPPDVANGLLLILLQNIRPTSPKTVVSMIAATPKPRLVKLIITPGGQESFTVGSGKHMATHYAIKVDIGGVAGALAPAVGKQPPDRHVWIAGEDGSPLFVKMEGPLYHEGPIWHIELACPTWPQNTGQSKQTSKGKN